MEANNDIAARLAAVHDAIHALPDDAFAEKYQLLKEQDKLREEASQYAVDLDVQRSDTDLLSELSGLRSQLRQLEKQKIDLVTQAGSGGRSGEMGNLGGVSLNAQMMEASGANRVQARIGVIKGILTDRGVDIPASK
ncbi:MAG: hypothetical protein U9N84_00575 [Actinomycetota bacterium]|nr:hypothetical protein [Actinomycetota bacterium]